MHDKNVMNWLTVPAAGLLAANLTCSHHRKLMQNWKQEWEFPATLPWQPPDATTPAIAKGYVVMTDETLLELFSQSVSQPITLWPWSLNYSTLHLKTVCITNNISVKFDLYTVFDSWVTRHKKIYA